MAKTSDTTTHTPPPTGFDPLAGVLAFALPGLGYVVRGEFKRGAYLVLGLFLLVLVGLFIGGLDAVDRVGDRWWFLAQAGLGPVAWGLDGLRNATGATPSIGRVNEIGTLFIVLAGMCNAIAVIDCLAPAIRDVRTKGGA